MIFKAAGEHNNAIYITTLTTILAITLLLWLSPAMSNDDAYLKALEEEVDSTSIPRTDANTDSSTYKKKPADRSRDTALFENRLTNELPATYHAYRRLNKSDQEKVVDYYYSHDKDMTATTHLLFNLYFSSKNKHQ